MSDGECDLKEKTEKSDSKSCSEFPDSDSISSDCECEEVLEDKDEGHKFICKLCKKEVKCKLETNESEASEERDEKAEDQCNEDKPEDEEEVYKEYCTCETNENNTDDDDANVIMDGVSNY